jgi:hypothetical protein
MHSKLLAPILIFILSLNFELICANTNNSVYAICCNYTTNRYVTDQTDQYVTDQTDQTDQYITDQINKHTNNLFGVKIDNLFDDDIDQINCIKSLGKLFWFFIVLQII